MKIVQILSQTHLTGAEVYAAQLSGELIENGHSVWVFSDKIHTPLKAPFYPLAVHDTNFLTRLRSAWILRQFLIKNNIQVIHTHSRAAVRVAWLARLGLKIGMVSTIHGRQHSSLGKRLFDQYGDFVICVCENLKKHLVQDFKMNPARIKILGNPVRFVPSKQASAKKSFKKIALIGRTSGPKGEKASLAIEHPFPQLLEAHPELSIDIIGGNIFELSLEAQKKISSHPRMEFLGSVSNLAQQMSSYDLIIGAGRVAIEALEMEVPVVAFGEYDCLGLVTEKTLDHCKESNFGDIGIQYPEKKLDLQFLASEIKKAMSAGNNPALAEKIRSIYSSKTIAKQIEEIYTRAFARRNYPKHIPILMYHLIPNAPIDTNHRIFVTKDNFENHLTYLKENGFTSLTFKDYQEFRTGQKSFKDFPSKPIFITFDDGYEDNLLHAAEILKANGMKAIIYLLADSNIQTNSWDQGETPEQKLLSKIQRQELLKTGVFEIGSHGFAHKKITQMNFDQAMHELRDSKKSLETEFGQEVLSFAYTYGAADPLVHPDLARQAGYQFALNTDTGGLHIEEAPHSVFRVSIFPEDGLWALRKKTSSWYRKYYFNKRGH